MEVFDETRQFMYNARYFMLMINDNVYKVQLCSKYDCLIMSIFEIYILISK